MPKTSGRIPSIDSTILDVELHFRALAEACDEQVAKTAMLDACRAIRESGQQFKPPIGLRDILEMFDARVERRLIWSSGRLDVHDQGYLILVDKRQHWRRQRFTVAHEIGHLIVIEALAGKPRPLRAIQEPQNSRRLEDLCDLAAAELLVPEDDFRAQLREFNLISMEAFQHLYDRYCCSRLVLMRRFTDVCPALSVSLWREFSRKQDESVEWRVDCCFRYPRETWVPRGLTSAKHLSPNLVHEAAVHGTAFHADVVLKMRSQSHRVCGWAMRLEQRKRLGPSQPRFQGMEVGDEPVPDPSVILFLWPKSATSDHVGTFADLAQSTAG